MILAVDIGNSNIVLGCIEDRKIKKEGPYRNGPHQDL